MKHAIIALSLALALAPLGALADDAGGAPPQCPVLTQQQKQQLQQTFETFRTQEEQLHKQMRAQLIGSLSPAHRNAIAGIIGNLAISANPDPALAAKQIDGLLSQGEQQRILSLHSAFRTQRHALHEQMRKQLESELPAKPKPPGDEHAGGRHEMQSRTLDAGTVVLKTLGHAGMPDMEMGMGHHGWMGPGSEGPPH
ncbi:MAG: hypothetical protein JO199_05545 [Candidatus Eremiobacteraeota bacterium]|nr:hypothetical protein [Candidatus Eremiobacteraeota bacterium]